MRILVTQLPANNFAKQKQREDSGRSSRHSSSFFTGMPLLQSKCACGGGCPRCKQELEIQTKLKIGEPGDKYEQEADRIADEVMRMPESLVQRQVEPEEEEEEMVQSKAIFSAINPLVQLKEDGNPAHFSERLESPLAAKSGEGGALPSDARSFMELRFGTDFSHVRVHTDTEANQIAAAIGARAFTLKHDIFFGAEHYQPTTMQTRRLLAHELTHVIQQEASGKRGAIQADFAIEPTPPIPTEALTPPQVQAAIAFNTALLTDADEIGELRDILGVSRQPTVIDENFVQGVARYQAQFGLAINGQVDSPTRRQLSREALAEARYLGSIDSEFTSVIEGSLGAFGLEQDDFGIDEPGRFEGSRALNPEIIREIRQTLATDRTQDLIQENVDILHSKKKKDTYSAANLDLPFIIALGVRESGVPTLFSRSPTLINTAGKDTHPEGRSGMDYFYKHKRAFTSRKQKISPVTTGFRPGREDRRPALIENRRLLLAFMVKTAADEQALRRFVVKELKSLLGSRVLASSTAEQLFNDLSIDALRSWKALMFAGAGYGQSAVQAVLRAQHSTSEPFSLEAILTLDNAPNADAARLDRARAVALSALVIEGDLSPIAP
jgi:hypothetical protein